MSSKIFLAAAAIVLVLVVAAATRPASYSVERSIIVAAPREVVYAQVSDFHAWQAWSPWAQLDPAMKATYTGPNGRPGATYAWNGNNQVGEGRMTLLEAQPPVMLDLQIDFLRPFASTSQSTFSFMPAGSGTLVAWNMTGKNHFLAKLSSLFVNRERMLGGDFERGLAQLKAVAERAARAQPARPAPAPAPAPIPTFAPPSHAK